MRWRSVFGVATVVVACGMTAAAAQPLNAEKPIDPVTGDAQPLGGVADEDRTLPAAPAPLAPPDGVTAMPAPGVAWAEHVSPSFRRWLGDGPQGMSTPVSADPAIRNQPDAGQRGSELADVENAVDKPVSRGDDAGGAGAKTIFLKRASRAHARSIVTAEGAVVGAELADGISMAPLARSRTKGTLFDRALPDRGAPPKLANGPLPGAGPLQDIPDEDRYDGAPLFTAEAAADEADDDAYVVALAKGELAGAEMGDKVSVVHVSQFAKGERPSSGELVVYPRSRFRPWGPINSFENVNSFQAINVEPLQSAEDPSDPSPVARSAYSIGNWDLPGHVHLNLSDNELLEFRDRFIDQARHPYRYCCGPNRVGVIHNPLALVLEYSAHNKLQGQIMTVIPLAPGIRAW